MIENVYVDEQQQVWAGTMNGLNKITYANKSYQIEQITTAHGLPSNEINQVKSRKGEVWVATSKGLVHLPNRQIDSLVQVPIFSTILVNNQLFALRDLSDLDHQQNKKK